MIVGDSDDIMRCGLGAMLLLFTNGSWAVLVSVDAMTVSYALCGGVFFFFFWKTCDCGFVESGSYWGLGVAEDEQDSGGVRS